MSRDDDISTPGGLLTLSVILALMGLGLWKLVDLTATLIKWVIA